MRRTIAVALLVAMSATSLLANRPRAIRTRPVTPPHVPACSSVQGLANIYFSLDGGQTFSGNSETPSRATTWGIAVFEDSPNVLVVSVGTAIYDSTDAGCTWSLRHTITDVIHHPLHATGATGGRAYVWAEEFVYRYDRGEVTKITIPEQIGGLGVNPSNREHVRVLGLVGGALWESFNGGGTWAKTGSPVGGFITAVAFDPANFNHIVVGSSPGRGVVTTDAGQVWNPIPDLDLGLTLCDIAFASPNVVWALLAVRSDRNFVFRSTNGGSRFQSLPATVDVENNVCLPLNANPHDPNVATIAYGSIHWINAATGSMTKTTCCDAAISRMVYSPVDPAIIYVFATPR